MVVLGDGVGGRLQLGVVAVESRLLDLLLEAERVLPGAQLDFGAQDRLPVALQGDHGGLRDRAADHDAHREGRGFAHARRGVHSLHQRLRRRFAVLSERERRRGDIHAHAVALQRLDLGGGVADILIAVADDHDLAAGIGGESAARDAQSALQIGRVARHRGVDIVELIEVVRRPRLHVGRPPEHHHARLIRAVLGGQRLADEIQPARPLIGPNGLGDVDEKEGRQPVAAPDEMRSGESDQDQNHQDHARRERQPLRRRMHSGERPPRQPPDGGEQRRKQKKNERPVVCEWEVHGVRVGPDARWVCVIRIP